MELDLARKRDHKAEYKRRLANAARRGLSRSQARGHAKAGEEPIRPLRPVDRERLGNALKAYRQSGRQIDAARSVGISAERLRRYLRENVTIKRRGRTLVIDDNRAREMTIISTGQVVKAILPDFDAASVNGEYLSTVQAFLLSNEPSPLRKFEGRSVTDTAGKSHPFETDPNTMCSERDWRCFEDHHIADYKRDDLTVPICRNCHRKVSDDQNDHPVFNPTADPMLDRIGHFLLGLADLLRLIVERLPIFAQMLIDRAALPEKDGAA